MGIGKQQIRKIAMAARMKNPQLRYGQAIFNAAYKDYPKEAESAINTYRDCFYDDSKVEIFLQVVCGDEE